MYLAKAIGILVSTTKYASLNGSELLMVARLDENYQPTVHAQVAVGTVGTGNEEIVIIATGSSVHVSNNKDRLVIDTAVVGIVGSLELNG